MTIKQSKLKVIMLKAEKKSIGATIIIITLYKKQVIILKVKPIVTGKHTTKTAT